MSNPNNEKPSALVDEAYDWETRYKNDEDLPWDIQEPAKELIEYFAAPPEGTSPHTVIEIGCGSGANALWLARNNCHVTATEISETALEKAKKRAMEANLSIDFHLADICEGSPVAPGSQNFAFDREVYHIIPASLRRRFVEVLASTLTAGGYWLSLAGSKDEERKNPQVGPPQLSAMELIEHIEPAFEIIRLERGSFILPNGHAHLAWKALYRKR
jgi:SAM-dependent methyltransferase